MTQMPHLSSMGWTFRDELMEVSLNAGGDKAYYIYDSEGNRARKVVKKGAVREEIHYLGGYEIYSKFVNEILEKSCTTVHVTDDKGRIALIEKENGQEVVRYQLNDHLGSSAIELDENANIISYEEYHPFGTTSYQKLNGNISQKRYKYVGKEHDNETGLYYYGARYYASWLCRFVSVDPLKEERIWLNPYNYCQNNPINKVDPTGALDEDPPKPSLIQNFQVNTNETGEFVSVTISEISNIVYDENGSVISATGKKEVHEDTWAVQYGDLYKSLNDHDKQSLKNELKKFEKTNPFAFDTPKLSLPDYSKNDGITLEENNNSLELPEIPSVVSKSLGAGSALGNALEKELAKPNKVKYARRHPTKLREIKPDVWERFYDVKANKALKVVKGIGRALGVVSTIGSIYDAIRNPTAGNILQAVTNTILLGARINPVTGIILGIADATGLSDYIFDTIGEAIMKVDFERHLRNSWSVAPIF
jgi:RHS repeat-associated protein